MANYLMALANEAMSRIYKLCRLVRRLQGSGVEKRPKSWQNLGLLHWRIFLQDMQVVLCDYMHNQLAVF
jgi:hypothetical protein